MQTNRTRLAGNRAPGGREDELRRPCPTQREGKRLDGLGNEPVEDPCLPLVRDLDQPRLAQDAEVVRDRRLSEPSELNSQTHVSPLLASRFTIASLVGSARALKRDERSSNSFARRGGAPGEQQVMVATFFIDIYQYSN